LREFACQFSPQGAWGIPEFSEGFLRAVLQYNWPGNVRELKNVIESLFLLDLPSKIDAEHQPARLRQLIVTNTNLSDGERELLLSTLFSTKWNKTKAAEKLQWSRMTLYRRDQRSAVRTPISLQGYGASGGCNGAKSKRASRLEVARC
jgi:transcriptional regulator of acetoin/glycerol metabolism